VRTPSRYDRDLAVVTGLQNAPAPYVFPVNFLQGSDNFHSEKEIAYEIGYRAQLGDRTTLSVAGYYNDYDDLRSTTSTPVSADYPFPYPVFFQNNLAGHTKGLELSANYQLVDWWRLHAGGDFLRENIVVKAGQSDATGALNETADPHHQYFLRSAMDLPGHLQFDAALRWIGSLTLDSSPTSGPVAGTVPSYCELNARIGWSASNRLELSVAGENLLHARHVEYGFPSSSREAILRSFVIRAEWHY
jgi:iron complex outermembrane receptor protein